MMALASETAMIISIHAPAGGATEISAALEKVLLISIHAPAGGATGAGAHPTPRRLFQFTPLREGRLQL